MDSFQEFEILKAVGIKIEFYLKSYAWKLMYIYIEIIGICLNRPYIINILLYVFIILSKQESE